MRFSGYVARTGGFCQKFEDIAGFVRFSFSSLLLCPFGYLLSRL